MDIEKIKSTIEKLPESEREAIMKMGELSEEELEKSIGGLSERAKNALFALGAVAILAVGSYTAGSRKSKKELDDVRTKLGNVYTELDNVNRKLHYEQQRSNILAQGWQDAMNKNQPKS